MSRLSRLKGRTGVFLRAAALSVGALLACGLALAQATSDFAKKVAEFQQAQRDNASKIIAARLANNEVSKTVSDGQTPLMLAARNGLGDAARQLLDKGADPLARDNQDLTALMHALLGPVPTRLSVVTALLERGADATTRDKQGRNVWHCLAEATPRTDTDVLAIAKLLEAAAPQLDSDAPTVQAGPGREVPFLPGVGRAPLMSASLAGNPDLVAYLLARGADPNRMTPQGLVALHWAAYQRRTEVIGLLFARDVKVVEATSSGWALHATARAYFQSAQARRRSVDPPLTEAALTNAARFSEAAATVLEDETSSTKMKFAIGNVLMMALGQAQARMSAHNMARSNAQGIGAGSAFVPLTDVANLSKTAEGRVKLARIESDNALAIRDCWVAAADTDARQACFPD